MLAIDCGNSRLKWARFEQGRILGRGAAVLGDGELAFAALGAAVVPGVGRILIANVADDVVGERIAATVGAQAGAVPEFIAVQAHAHGIDCGYREPARLGVDRWLAMIAAKQATDGPFVVVSAGTAVTFDAVDAAGRHLGGLIFPGDQLIRDALATRTGRIGKIAAAGVAVKGLALLGRSTEEAVGHGAWLALAAAIDRACAAVTQSLSQAPDLLLTGGDAGALAPWLETGARVRADLVLEGLSVIANSKG